MAQDGYDIMMNLTDSRYRLSMVVGRRAAQLKSGMPTLLEPDEMPEAAGNTVSVAMKELQTGKALVWGTDLPTEAELRTARARERRDRLGDGI
jgi:DNA-directed RNA polymerase, subunit K/omega